MMTENVFQEGVMKKKMSVITILVMLIVTVVSPKIEITVNAAIDSEPIFLIDQITGDGISTGNAIIVLENNGTQNVGKLIAEKGDHHVYIFEGVNYENLLQDISFKRINPENTTQVWNTFTAGKGNSNKYSITAWDNTAFSDQFYDLKFVEDRLDFTHKNNLMVDATLIDIEYKDPNSLIPKLDKLALKINNEYLFHLNKNGSIYTLPDFIKLQTNDDIKVVDKRFPSYATTKSVQYKEDSDFCVNLNALNPHLANKFDILDSTDCEIKNPYKNDYIPTGTKVIKPNVRYVNSTFYDYLSDWELNNLDRFDKNTTTDNWSNGVKDDLYVQFRHFNQALSDYYEDNNIINPIYTGHFDHHEYNGSSFNRVADGLSLYGYKHHTEDLTLYNKFFAYNNSMFDINGIELNQEVDKPYGAQIVKNIVDSNLSSSGELMINDLSSPFFNSQFLLGGNSKKTVLAHLYENVDFPFYEEKRNGSDVSYWTFDSHNHPAQMKRDTDTYFLDDTVTPVVNRNSAGEALEDNGFFPFNDPVKTNASNTDDVYKYNYGFGVRMDIPFHLTDDGKIDEEDIIFEFSGDDDVWIFIDGKLVLDLGGPHARVAGQINFKDLTYEITTGHIKNLGQDTDTTKTGTIDIDGKLTDRHILSVYYMERGLWESNLKITFNFPEDDIFVLEKELELDNVNEEFKSYFENQKFEFEIKNYATHYQTVKDSTDEKTGFKVNQESINDYGSVASNAFESIENAKYKHSLLTDIQSYTNKLILKDQENAVFRNQFRKGSYLYINETLDDNLYQKPTWKIIENDITILEGSGNFMNDNREEPVIEGNPIKNSYDGYGNIEEAYKDKTLRYGTLETTGATEPTHMRVIYTNKVKTGDLIIKKEFLGVTDQEAEFEVKVIFEEIEKTYQFKLKNDETYEIKGLPYGTRYEVKEIDSYEYTLLSINSDSSLTEITGSIDQQELTYTFLNTPNSKLEIEKNWDNTSVEDQFEVSMKLFKNDEEYKDFKLNKENRFKASFNVLKYDANGNEINYKFYEYFGETKLEDGNIFKTEDGHRFEVTYGITDVTNKLIPSSDLTFTKVRDKDGNVIKLNGAHFTLKAYKIDGFNVDTDYFTDYLNNFEITPEHIETINSGESTFKLENLYSDYVYFLQETKAPTSMQLPKGAWMIHIDEDDKIHIVAEFQDSMPALKVNENEGGDIYIYNVPISTLPLTGGYMRHYSVIGLSIIGLSYVLYKNGKKREKKENE